MEASITHNRSASVRSGYWIALIGTVIWSSAGVFVRYLTTTYAMPPLVLAFWRDLMVAMSIAVALVIFKPAQLLPGKQVRFLLGYGLLLALFNGLWTFSVSFNGAAAATVMAYCSAAFTAVLGWRLFNERLDWVKMVAVILSLVGCALVAGAHDPAAWRTNAFGVITGLSSGFCFALYSLMGREAAHRSLPPWTTMLYSFGFAAMFLLILVLVVPSAGNLFHLGGATIGWLALFVLAAGPSVGGYGLYMVSLTRLPASVANLIATLEPAFTAVLAFMFLGEKLTAVQLIGGLVIIAGVAALRLRGE